MYPKRFKIIPTLAVILALSIFSVSVYAQSDPEEIETLKEKKDKEGYIINLKDLIKKSKKKIDRVNVELKEQAKQRRNQQREEKAREYFNQAMRLYDEGKLEEAQKLWKKAIKITEHPEMKGYISESVKKTKKQQEALRKEEDRRIKRLEFERGFSAKEVNDAYDAAVKLFKQKNYLAARDEFERVDTMFPDHKATRSYLMVIDQEIEKEQQRLIEEKLREETIARRKEKEEWKRELEQREKRRQADLQNQAESIYKEAITFYKTRQFEQAKDKFKEVEWIIPDYKSTLKYLSRIDLDIEREKRRSEKERQDLRAQELEDERLREERALLQKQRQREVDEQEKIKRLEEEANFVYKSAINLYKNKQYEKAQDKFKEVQRLYPGYKSTAKYLTRVNNLIQEEQRWQEEQKRIALEEKLAEQQQASERARKQKEKQLAYEEEKRLKRQKEEAKLLYKSAVSLYKKKLYVAAQDKFLELEEVYPDYKSTVKYLNKINKQLAKDTQQPVKEYRPKPKPLKEKIAKVKTSPVYVGKDEEAVVRKAVEQRRAQFEQEAAQKYSEALSFYKHKNFIEAKRKFIAVEALYPGYKDTLEYLDKIDSDIGKQMETSIVKHVDDGPSAEPLHDEIKDKQELTGELKRIYEEALVLYKARQYIHSKEKFLQLSYLAPYHQKTKKYLKTLDKKIEKQKDILGRQKERGSKSKSWRTYFGVPGEPDTMSQKELEKFEWNLKQDELVSQLKAKEEHSEYLKKKEYEDFRTQLDTEEAALERVEVEREKQDKQRQKKLRKAMLAEEKAKENARIAQERAEIEKEKEAKRQMQEKELAEKKEKQRQEKLARERKRKEELEKQRRKEEQRLAKKREAQERLKRLKLEEIENKKRAEALARQIAEQEQSIVDQEKAAELARLKEIERQKEEERQIEEEEEKAKRIHQEKEERLARLQKKREDQKARQEYEEKRTKEMLAERDAKRELEEVKKKQEDLKKRQKKDVARERKAIQKQLAERDQEYKVNWQKDVEVIYREAIQLFKNGNYLGAKAKFAMVDALSPGYKSARAYVKKSEKRVLYEEDKIRKDIQRQRAAKEKALEKEECERIRREKIEEEERIKQEKEARKKEAEELARKKKEEELAQKKKVEEEARKKREEEIARKKETEEQERKAKEEKLAQKKKAKEEALIRKKEEKERRRKLKEEQAAKRKEAKELARKKKEEEREKAKKELAEQAKKRQEQDKLKEQINLAYREALDLYKQKKYALSKEKFHEFEKLLASGEFDQKYMTSMRKRIDRDRKKVDEKLVKERKVRQESTKVQIEQFKQEKSFLEKKRLKELEQLEKRIRAEEKRLAREKEIERKRLLKKKKREQEMLRKEQERRLKEAKRKKNEEEKLAKPLRAKKTDLSKSKVDNSAEQKRAKQEAQKKKELEWLVKDKQKELELERKKVREEFNQNLNRLYLKAIQLYKTKSYKQAKRIFSEINDMSPKYKKTNKYLAKIDKQLAGSLNRNKDDITTIGSQKQEAKVIQTDMKSRRDIVAEALDMVESKM